MSKFTKFAKKLLPRLGAILIAAAVGIGIYLVNYVVLYTPDKNTEEPKFEIQKDPNVENGDEDNTPSIEASNKIFNFLIMGHDRAASLTDVIMLVNYNTEIQRITVMQFPRDTYIEVDDYYYHKVNGLYNYCVNQVKSNGSKDPDRDGCKLMAEFFEKNLAMTIHYSAVMDLDGFGNIVDAIGGVDMYVPMDMYYSDPTQGLYINLKEGYQHLDGDSAEQFVRYRYGYATGDIGRGDAQKVFISAFLDKLLTSITDANTITSLAQNLVTYVESDVTPADIVYFGKNFIGIGNKAGAVQLSNVKLMTMPGRATLYNGISYYVMNKEYMANLVNDYFNIYNTSVLWSFDVNEVFVTSENSQLRDIYLDSKDNITLTIYNAGSLEENGIE
ncbi:MAG: LCP family protein [Clostridia bacterium]|nr:LCP family protein [Clostridia bacterium]